MTASRRVLANGRVVTTAQVVSVKRVGFKPTYDLTVEKDHNYFANGIAVHNCEYHESLEYQGKRNGVEYLKFQKLYLSYRHKNLDLYPLGPLKRALRGDCVVGSTMVNTDAGFVSFRELGFKNGLHSTTGIVDTPFGRKKVSHTYKRTNRETVRIATRNGLTIRGTPEHPLMVLTSDLSFEWRRLDAIKEGDWILSRTSKNSPIFGTNKVPKDVATLLGIFTANGYRSEVSSDDPKVVRRLYEAAKNVTGHEPTYLPSKDKRLSASSHYVKVGKQGARSGTFQDVLAQWGYNNRKSKHKEIPLSVRTASKEIIHEYLDAYFSCDSGINGGATSASRNRGLTTGVEIELSSASRRLVCQLQVLLLHIYGIVSRKYKRVEFKRMGRNKKNPEKHYETWILSLTGYDAWLFVETFKNAKIQKYKDRIKEVRPGYGSDRRQVPYVRELVNTTWKQFPKGRYRSSDGESVLKPKRPAWGYVGGSSRKASAPLSEYLLYEKESESALQFLRIVNRRLAEKISKLLAIKAHYEQVVKVTRHTKKVPVYDITVPDKHAFTANGLVSHNTRVVAAIDELGWFPYETVESNKENPNEEEAGEREFANADEVYTSLSNSLATVRIEAYNLYKKGISHIPTGAMFAASSPASWKDKICRLLKDSEDSKVMLGLNLPTWEINPAYTRDHPFITEEYRKNSVKAERDFGANPPELNSALYDKGAVLELFTGRMHHIIATVTCKENNQPEQLTGKVVPQITRDRWPATVLALDGGYSNNAFSFALGHLHQPEGGGPKLHVFTVGEVVPKHGRKVNFVRIYSDVVHYLCKNCNVKFVYADRWNSLMLLQSTMRDFPHIKAEQYTLKPIDFRSFDQDIIDNRAVVLPSLEMEPDVIEAVVDFKRAFVNKAASHLYLQFLTVRSSGGVVTKGDGYTDDLYRALVLLATMSRKPRVAEEVRKYPMIESALPVSVRRAIVVGRSGLGKRRI